MKILEVALTMRSLALAALASAACAADSPVFELDESTHAEFIQSPLSVMVKYYAPVRALSRLPCPTSVHALTLPRLRALLCNLQWCGHCKALVPEYDEAATALSTYQPPMRLGKIDASTHTSVAADQDISGFPTLLVWKDGKSEAYDGERTAQKITEYMIEKAPKKEQLFPLFEAVAMQAKFKELEELVEKEPLSPRQTTSPSGMTALMVANSTEVVKLLLDKGADLHAEDNAGNSVLMNQLLRFAQGAKNSATVKSIIDAGAEVLVSTKDNTTSLHLAVMGETTEIAETLVLKGATVDAKTLGFQTPLSFACRHGSIKMVNWLLDRGANPKRAIAAAMDRWWSGAKEGLNIVKLLVAQKAPVSLVNAKDQTPLHVVAAHQTRLNKTADAIQFLLDHGASVAARDGVSTVRRLLLLLLLLLNPTTRAI